MTFLLDATVSRYRRPLIIRDCMRNKILRSVKSNLSFNEMNKKDLPTMHSTVFRCLLVVLVYFGGALLHNSSTVTPFIRRRE